MLSRENYYYHLSFISIKLYATKLFYREANYLLNHKKPRAFRLNLFDKLNE